jgi:hypothetical protein
MNELLALSIGISITGFLGLMAGLIYLARLVGEARAGTERITASAERIAAMQEAMWLQLRRQYADIDQDLQEIKDLLQGGNAA